MATLRQLTDQHRRHEDHSDCRLEYDDMKAARIHNFGPPDVVLMEDVPRPAPAAGELLVRVFAAGVGPWDALIREGKSKVSPSPPLTLGSDLSGFVDEVGPGVTGFSKGDQVFGVTNPAFCGAQAEFAVAIAGMMAQKPQRLSHIEAASVPVVAVTAWQMLFEYGQAKAGQTVLILGAAGNVGAYAVQLAATAGLQVIAAVGSKDADYVRTLGAETAVEINAERYEGSSSSIDLLLDTVGGEARERAVHALKPGGMLVSVVSPEPTSAPFNVHSVFFYVEVTTARLNVVSGLIDLQQLNPRVGTVLPLRDVRSAHEMLAGAPHKPVKIVLQIAP
jgi:NADPH:quinone reductase-like Zn-dependent oxidoreductase